MLCTHFARESLAKFHKVQHTPKQSFQKTISEKFLKFVLQNSINSVLDMNDVQSTIQECNTSVIKYSVLDKTQ